MGGGPVTTRKKEGVKKEGGEGGEKEDSILQRGLRKGQ